MRIKPDEIINDKKLEYVIEKVIKLTPSEAKEKITYKDSDGNCLVIIEGKEIDCVILSMTSKGEISVGVKK